MSRNPLVSSPSGGGGNHHHNSRPGSGSSSRSSSPSPSLYNVPSSTGGGGGRRRRRGTRRVVSTLRRIERGICTLAKLFPLSIVYGGQTWAAYTEGWSISFTHMKGFKGAFLGTLGFVIYGLAVWSYTTAVFRDPGSPLTNKHSYSHLPTTEPSASFPSGPITVKSSGTPRFCKKCQCRKPDRAHHCSTCNRCVLRMDHHCPWLATCLGLRNYKPFLLFLIYTSLLCILSFLVSTGYVYATIFNSDDLRGGFGEGSEITPVNWILLATISGIIGLVLSGFTIWHVLLASSGMTTIESLEKVRYSNPAIFHGQQGGHGGISDWSDAAERSRAQATYQAYLDDEALAKLPHAFDLGRRQNLRDIFGTRRWAWFLPLPMTREEERRLDGWRWETSPVWREGVERVRRGREERIAQLGASGSGGSQQQQQQQYSNSAASPRNNNNSGFSTQQYSYPQQYQQQQQRNPHHPHHQQKLVPRSAGEPLSGLVRPSTTTTAISASNTSASAAINPSGISAMESRIRKDWAFLDEDPSFLHATRPEDDSDVGHDDDDDEEDSEDDDDDDEEESDDSGDGRAQDRRGLMEHLKLRGGKAPRSGGGKKGRSSRKADIYHQEMFGAGARGSASPLMGGMMKKSSALLPKRKNVAAMMGAAVPRGGAGGMSKADRILGRSSRYDDDVGSGSGSGNGRAGEAVPLQRMKHVPLMVAAGRVQTSASSSPSAITTTTGRRAPQTHGKEEEEDELMDLASPVHAVMNGVIGALAGMVDPGMVNRGEAKGQGGGGMVGGVVKVGREVGREIERGIIERGGMEWGGWGGGSGRGDEEMGFEDVDGEEGDVGGGGGGGR